ncbi:MAG: cellulase family glycosylhydrolase [Planctomycetes bacterium]|nr:cellulase family glycosylhydrolase [Planctomycetota bacterium]
MAGDEAATAKSIYTFEDGINGWWKFNSPAATVTLSKADEGVDNSTGSLKVSYNYGKGINYLGVGVQPKWSLKGKTSFKEYAGGTFSLALKSNAGSKVQVEIRTTQKKSYSISIPHVGKIWGTYTIPLSEFKNKDESLPIETASVEAFAVIPYKGSGKDQALWIDNIKLSTQPLELSEEGKRIIVTGTVSSSGKPVAGAKVTLADAHGNKPTAEDKSGADGKYTLSYTMGARHYAVTPAEANPETTDYKGSVQVEGAGYALMFKDCNAKVGTNEVNIELYPAQTLKELKVEGNRLVDTDGKEVWLQGMSVDSLEWSSRGDYMLRSVVIAIRDWKANCVRIPMRDSFWFGKDKYQKDGGESYRKLLDRIIDVANSNGAYVAFDLHRFGAPMPEHVEFWKDAAAHYKNRPGVLFEIFNEPHGISWDVWRNGGSTKKQHKENAVVENKEKNSQDYSPGMQALVNAVRSTGAKNIIIAAGLSWSYDLSGVVNGFALEDPNGNGIMYSHHNYPWKKGWQKAVLDAAEKHPIFIGEVGNIRAWSDFPFINANERYEDLSKMEWPIDMLGMIQKYRLNWTGFSFHPRCGPMIIKDWDYTPTEYWGVFVKRALAGEQFTLNRLR